MPCSERHGRRREPLKQVCLQLDERKRPCRIKLQKAIDVEDRVCREDAGSRERQQSGHIPKGTLPVEDVEPRQGGERECEEIVFYEPPRNKEKGSKNRRCSRARRSNDKQQSRQLARMAEQLRIVHADVIGCEEKYGC